MTILRMMRIAAGAEKLRFDPKKKFRKAYSLAELILGAAVIAAFLVRIYQAYAATSASDRFQDFVQEIGLLNGETHQQFINTQGYGESGADLVPAIATSVPRKYLDATKADALTTVYGAPVTVTANGNGGFDISTSNVPGEVCQRVVFGDMGRNLVSMSIGDATVPLPVQAADIKTYCTDAVTAGTMNVTYTFDALDSAG